MSLHNPEGQKIVLFTLRSHEDLYTDTLSLSYYTQSPIATFTHLKQKNTHCHNIFFTDCSARLYQYETFLTQFVIYVQFIFNTIYSLLDSKYR